MNKNILKKALFVPLILFILLGGYLFFTNHSSEIEEVSLTELASQINEEKVEEIQILNQSAIITLKDGEKIKSIKEPEGTFSETITNYGADEEKLKRIDIIQKDRMDYGILIVVVSLTIFLLLLGLFLYFIFRRTGKSIYFGKVKDRIFGETKERNKEYNKRDFLKLLKEEESKTLEFKSSLRWDYHQGKINKDLEKVIAKTVAAFMNTKGGVLFIGVDDNGEVIGLEKDLTPFNGSRDGFLKKLSEIINKYLGPENHVLIDPKFLAKDEKDICALKVDKSNKPVYLRDGSENKFYIRTQNSSMELTGIEADNYKEKRFS